MKKSRTVTAVISVLMAIAIVACGTLLGCGSDDSVSDVPPAVVPSESGDESSGSTSRREYEWGEVVGIELSSDKLSVSLSGGETATIEASVQTDNGNRTLNNVVWTSSDESVATVRSGIVTPVGIGKAEIRATVKDLDGEEYYADCLVTVTHDYTLTVGIKDDVKNFGYYNPNTREYEGMEIELAYMIADELCYAEDNVELVPLNPDERADALNEGDVDIVVATYTVTDERSEVVNFSSPYYTDYVQVLAGEEYSSFGIPDLKGVTEHMDQTGAIEPFKIGTAKGSTAYDGFDEYCEDNDIPITSASVLGEYFANVEIDADDDADGNSAYENCWQALVDGEIDAFMADHSILQSYATGFKKYKILSDKLASQDYAVATAKESPFTDYVDAIIDGYLSDGTMAALMEEYGLEMTV